MMMTMMAGEGPLQGFNSVVDSSPPGLNQHSSASVAKVPKSYIPRSITPPPSLPKSVKKSESEPEDTKPHIRASSIPRPRAVVSSPDNDQLFGNQKLKLQRPSSASKRHNLLQSRQLEGRYTQMSTTSKKHLLAQSKQSEGHCTRTNATASKKPLRNNKYEETAHKSDVKAKKGSAVDVRVPITNITKAKPCFMNT